MFDSKKNDRVDTAGSPALALLCAMVLLAGALLTPALAQNARQKPVERHAAKRADPLTLAINEGAAGNADFADILFRYEEFGKMVGEALGAPVAIISARDRDKLQERLKKHDLTLLLSRPNDVPAQAVRDFGYLPIAAAKENYRTMFIVVKDSPLKSLADVKGKTIVTPDLGSNMWRSAKAMLRESNIDMTKEDVKSMRDQAAIGWSVTNGMFDVGVVNSASGVGRNWEKSGGRVLARSREQINMPFIATPDLPAARVAKLRAAILGLDATDKGRAILKYIGLPAGFRDAPRQEYLDLLKWLGEEGKAV